MKKVSIITINYNNREGLRRTIESVIHQTFREYEYIIIDGGSTDGSLEVIREYSDAISYWVSEPDKGIYHAMNKGVKIATGEYCNFMNSGDRFYHPDVLEKIFSCNFTADIITGSTVDDGNQEPIQAFNTNNDISMYHFYSATIGHQSSFIRRILLINNPYDENLKIVSDWKFFIQTIILNNCTFQATNLIVASMNKYGISMTQNELNQKERKKVLEELLPPRIRKDYNNMDLYHSPLLQLIPTLNKTYGFHKFIYYVVKYLLSLYTYIKPSTKKNKPTKIFNLK